MNVKIEDDQANELRSLFDEIIEEEQEHSYKKAEQNKKREIDILNLPPRKEVHTNSRTHLKIGRPLTRFVLVVIILSSIIIGAYYYWGDELLQLIN